MILTEYITDACRSQVPDRLQQLCHHDSVTEEEVYDTGTGLSASLTKIEHLRKQLHSVM